MMRKQVTFIANSLDSAYKFQGVLSEVGVEVTAGSTAQVKKLLAPGMRPDLVIFEARSTALGHLEEIESLIANRAFPLLLIVDEEGIADLSFPKRTPFDFVMCDAGRAECVARVRRLLGGPSSSEQAEVITVDCMELNLATYQVSVAGDPVDFTYLEYALLAYLVQNPNRTFSRDVLLQNVWGFDYCGGSRTVDVHVRRIRAKLGPQLAEHLETIRGVGYLWK